MRAVVCWVIYRKSKHSATADASWPVVYNWQKISISFPLMVMNNDDNETRAKLNKGKNPWQLFTRSCKDPLLRRQRETSRTGIWTTDQWSPIHLATPHSSPKNLKTLAWKVCLSQQKNLGHTYACKTCLEVFSLTWTIVFDISDEGYRLATITFNRKRLLQKQAIIVWAVSLHYRPPWEEQHIQTLLFSKGQ